MIFTLLKRNFGGYSLDLDSSLEFVQGLKHSDGPDAHTVTTAEGSSKNNGVFELMSACVKCDAKLTYSYRNVNGDTVLQDIYQVDGDFFCKPCIETIILQTHHIKKTGRKNIKITLELDRPTHCRNNIINKKEDDC